MAKVLTAIDTKDISQISKEVTSLESEVSQNLSAFNSKLSSCPLNDGKITIVEEIERELLKLYSELPWTEQLKLRISKILL